MTLTEELVALCERPVEPPLPEALPEMLSDAEHVELADRLYDESLGRPLWVFAYGSLIWNPVFAAEEERLANAPGWHRSFCIELDSWRGTPEQPGLMMALDFGGACHGVAYRVADQKRREAIEALTDREVGPRDAVDAIRWIRVNAGGEAIRALVFWAAPRGPYVRRKLPLDQVAHMLARACGHMGSGAAYLYRTVAKLDEHGIRDRNLWRLQQMVADEIRTVHALR
jgi:cation transport protein ChaC